MNDKITLNIWEREFHLDVVYDCYAGENVTPLQSETFHALNQNNDCINSTLQNVKAYCVDNYGDEVTLSDLNNIFKYVVLKAIFIKRDHQNHIFALMCHFKLDMEHGLALVFQENKLVKIGAEDIIL